MTESVVNACILGKVSLLNTSCCLEFIKFRYQQERMVTAAIICSNLINPNHIWGGGPTCLGKRSKFSEKCPCSHHDNTAIINQIYGSLNILIYIYTYSFNLKFKEKGFCPIYVWSKQRHGWTCPHPRSNTIRSILPQYY